MTCEVLSICWPRKVKSISWPPRILWRPIIRKPLFRSVMKCPSSLPNPFLWSVNRHPSQTSTINYRNTGILLTLRPQINSRGLVTLEIAQEVSSASATTTGVNNTPTISVRQAKTTLTTADNQTVVLGGLIREDVSRTSQRYSGIAQRAPRRRLVRLRVQAKNPDGIDCLDYSSCCQQS